jgi:catechol 2,3-dioxygenase-like lactoylglutathione lyase family enzyme
MPPSSDGQLLRSAPYFPVTSVERSAGYYEQVLGFHREYGAGSPLEFAILTRDGQALMLRRVPANAQISPNEKQGGTWDVFFWVRDARALHSELSERGADVVYGPVVQEAYQMEEFAVRDQDGYVLGFGQALPASARHS